MKADKKPAAEILAFYQGGAKVHATTTHSKDELEAMMEKGISDGKTGFVKINTVNEDDNVADDSLTLLLDKMLFYSVIIKNDSKLILPDKKIAVVGG